MAATGRIHQAAAIPVRDGQVCLITSSSGRRWIVPKGVLEPGKTPAEIAAQEAWEEAGLAGEVDAEPVGTFAAEKFGRPVRVAAYVMQVGEEFDRWPERHRRQRQWVSWDEALQLVDNDDLRALLAQVAEQYAVAFAGG